MEAVLFADVIVDISQANVDRPFEYIIPERLAGACAPGTQVNIPFGKGNGLKKGFVIAVKDEASFDVARLKEIDSVAEGSVALDAIFIKLADFIRKNYGGTMNQALKTVLPVKAVSKPVETKFVCMAAAADKAGAAIARFERDKRSVAKLRLMRVLAEEGRLPLGIVKDRLNIADSTIKALAGEGLISVEVVSNLRKAPGIVREGQSAAGTYNITLNSDQRSVAEDIEARRLSGDTRPSLIRGVTGSGKTEIYIDIINRCVGRGEQAVVLIPEIALTFQTVMRFYRKFGDRISVINSRLTPAQKHDQLEKARRGDVDIIIGPRSALFAPFKNLGVIIIDEEHESTYRNEGVPRYHSREVAIERARLTGGIVVMGSATPSVESYHKAETGEYRLYTLEKRAAGARMATVEVVDLREELAAGNRSMVSGRLKELIADRLSKEEQIMLFINRRGHSSFVSCRNCGTALKCPHCDVSLKYHNNGKLVCHYCGYEIPMVKTCPECGSKYIGTFGTGTQKVEEEINRLFPEARTIRMDFDTTKEKDGHAKILSAFAAHEADILIGTQMIVKGHDFANVTLVGIMAADLSLYSDSYEAPEKTFQLLTQAAGRAGRGEKAGNVVIQTYSPDNYAVRLGAEQDYKGFFEFEMDYRKLLGYPPVMNMLGILFSCENRDTLEAFTKEAGKLLEDEIPDKRKVWMMGPVDAALSKIKDRYRKIIYLKSEDHESLVDLKDRLEKFMEKEKGRNVFVTFDFSSIS